MEKIGNWTFGDQADVLANKVLLGEKIATCALYDGNSPKVGELNYIRNSRDEIVCLTRVTSFENIEYGDVNDTMAVDEGEKDLNEWRNIHKQYFINILEKQGEIFDIHTMLIYIRFEKV